MANILDIITVGNIKIIVVDGDPTGLSYGTGTLAIRNDGGGLYYNNGVDFYKSLDTTDSSPITAKDGVNFTIQNTSDITKQLQFNLSGITTGTTRTLTIPNVSGTLPVGTGTSGNFAKWTGTNTITSTALINDSGAGTLSIGDDNVGINGVTTLQLTSTGGSIFMQSFTSITAQTDSFYISQGSGSFYTAQLATNLLTNNRIYTLPDVAGTFALINGSQTFTSGTWNATPIGILYGGTGQTTANAGLNSLLPSQTSNVGKVLQTNGTNTSWVSTLIDSSSITSINYQSRTLSNTTPIVTLNWNSQKLFDASGNQTVDWNSKILYHGGGSVNSVDWQNGTLTTSLGSSTLNWESSILNGTWSTSTLGIGTTTPSTILHISETSVTTPRGILNDQYSTSANGARITMRKARGTFSSPSIIVSGDALASWTGSGYDGTNFIDSGKIIVTSAGTIGTGIIPSTMAFQTMTSSGVLTTAITIDQSQDVTIGQLYYNSSTGFVGIGVGTSPASSLHVASTSTSVPRGILADEYSTATNGARVGMRKARGTFASPTTILTGDILGSWSSWGYDGTNFIESGKITSTSIGTISTGIVPSTMIFQTMNTLGVLSNAIIIDQSQNISLINHSITGTAGAGYGGYITQSAAPTSLSNGAGFRMYADSTGRFAWIANGFNKTFDGLSNTADRVYTLPDVSGTITVLGNTTTGSGNIVLATAPTISGGVIGGLTTFGVRSTGSGAFDLRIANSENLTNNRTLTITLNDVSRTLNIAGNITTGGALTLSGAFATTLTVTNTTTVTLPTTGTLATLSNSETLTTKLYQFSNAPANNTAEGIIIQLTSDDTLVFGDVVYMKSNGNVGKADASQSTTAPVMGMAAAAITSGNSGSILLQGTVRSGTFPALTVGGVVYLGTTPGTSNNVTQTIPSSTDQVIQVLGVTLGGTKTIYFNPQLNFVTHI